MKITYNEKETKQFKELKPSDVFRTANELYANELYMVTQEVKDRYNFRYNATNLTTGQMVAFHDEASVELVGYEFRVNR